MQRNEIVEALDGMLISGIYCSSCDHVIEVFGEPVTNNDYFDAAQMHHARYHAHDDPQRKTSYDIRASRQNSTVLIEVEP